MPGIRIGFPPRIELPSLMLFLSSLGPLAGCPARRSFEYIYGIRVVHFKLEGIDGPGYPPWHGKISRRERRRGKRFSGSLTRSRRMMFILSRSSAVALFFGTSGRLDPL